jgi:hypothetical protein
MRTRMCYKNFSMKRTDEDVQARCSVLDREPVLNQGHLVW